MGEVIELERRDKVAIIRLNRPPMNAINRQIVQELRAVTDEIAADKEIGAAVLTGSETIFAAGADISDFKNASSGEMFTYLTGLQDTFTNLAELPKVTIAAINGYALGGGCELALTTDFRFAADDAQIGQPEILLGLIPGAGGTQRLPRLVGKSKAKKIIMAGRPVKAEDAKQIGLVDEVFPAAEVLDKAIEAAQRYAKGPLVALAAAKASIDRGFDADIDTGLSIERAAFAMLFGTEDAKEGVKSFFEKGPGKAEFKGR